MEIWSRVFGEIHAMRLVPYFVSINGGSEHRVLMLKVAGVEK